MSNTRGIHPSTTLWLAASGGTADRTRIALTAVGSAVGTLALLAAATVEASGLGDGPYTTAVLNQPGLHPGIVIGLVALCIPLLAFTGQCSRIGAPARDRRLAALRMQGATPRDVVKIAAVETGLSAGIGALVGLGSYFVLRLVFSEPVTATYTLERDIKYADGSTGFQVDTITGPALRLPTDVLPSIPVFILLLLAVPVAATLFAVLALRRVAITPFGVVRNEQPRPLRTVPAVLFLVGTVGLALNEGIPGTAAARVLFLALLIATGVGLLLGTTALASMIGRALVSRTSSPSLLIASRRMLAAPAQAGRSGAALLLIVLLWSFALGVRVYLVASSDDQFYADAMALINVSFAVGAGVATLGLLVGAIEGVVSRRRVLAGLSAAGTPRSVLERAVLAEVLLPIAVPVVLAAAAGILGARGVLGTSVQNPETTVDGNDALATVTQLSIPWTPLLLLVFGTLLALLLATAAALPLLRRSIDPLELRAT